MEPALTIVDYLWDSRNTWFEGNPGCGHTFEEHTQGFLDQIPVEIWLNIEMSRLGPTPMLKYCTADEWDDVVGPTAQDRQLQQLVDYHMHAATELIALQASEERKVNE